MKCGTCDLRLTTDDESPSYEEFLEDSGRDWDNPGPGFVVFGRDSKPMAYSKWVWTIEYDHDYKIVGHDHVGDGDGFVSTVWLGINHNFAIEDRPPIIFESMVFNVPDWYDYQDRYFTEGEAIAAHKNLVAKVKASLT
jgi:hypothetical protein